MDTVLSLSATRSCDRQLFFLPDEYFKKIRFLQSRELFLYPLKIADSSEVSHFPKSVILTGNGS